jgi:hypothetical protein
MLLCSSSLLSGFSLCLNYITQMMNIIIAIITIQESTLLPIVIALLPVLAIIIFSSSYRLSYYLTFLPISESLLMHSQIHHLLYFYSYIIQNLLSYLLFSSLIFSVLFSNLLLILFFFSIKLIFFSLDNYTQHSYSLIH